jgi:hypothetical protein
MHCRALSPQPTAATLTARLIGIGVNLAATPEPDADIEMAVVHATTAATGTAC